MPRVCFHCGQTSHVKMLCPLLSGSGLVGQSFSQPRVLVQGFDRSIVRQIVASRSEAGNSFGTQ